MRINQFIINRLNRNALEIHKQVPPKNIAVIKLDPTADFSAWSNQMIQYFNHQPLHLNIFEHSEKPSAKDDHFFESLDNNEDLNILVVDQNDLERSKKCIIYSDLVIVATSFSENSKLKPIEKKLDIYKEGLLGKKVYLLMLHDNIYDVPKGTAKWLKQRNIDLIIHLRKNHEGEIARFCRILTQKANGLVLWGGGAKGFAHIGVVKAMQKKGIPIDFIGGTSAGALYGLTMAYCDFDMEAVEAICDDSVKKKITSKDLDVPLISIMSGKKLTVFIKHLFKERDIEDIWVNSYCVSANFTKAELTVHERGEHWSRVCASISIPGIFPPVVIDPLPSC